MEFSAPAKAFLLLLILIIGGSANAWMGQSDAGKLGVISLEGQITPTSAALGSNSITPDSVREKIDLAEQRNVDAVLIEINSGGGSVVASKDVKRVIEGFEGETVCRIRDVGASGGYLVALGCDSVVADPMSLTGSIGVTASYLEYSDLMEELGISYVEVESGERKVETSPLQEPTEEELDRLGNRTEIVHEHFLDLVKAERSLNTTEGFESGRIVLGTEARRIGLVDDLGGREVAIKEAENMTGLDLETVEIQPSTDFSFLSLLTGPGAESGFVSLTELSMLLR